MELQGTIKKIFDTQSFGSSGFQKRELILLTEEQYPQPIKIEFLSEKTVLLDQYSEGDKVNISINLRGREWQNPQGEIVYFNSITGWRLEKLDSSTGIEPTSVTPNTPTQPLVNDNPFAEEEDDLPF